MKLKKVVSICNKSKVFRLFDKVGESGEIEQWLGDGSAIYRLNGLPILDEDSLCAVFDISEKQLKTTLVWQSAMPGEINAGDTDPAERQIKDDDFFIIYGGTEMQPLKTRNGIIFIQRKYLSPLEDVAEMVRLYERSTPEGQTYIVAKVGLLIAALIFPYNAVKEKFVNLLEEITRECRRTLNAPKVYRIECGDDQGEVSKE